MFLQKHIIYNAFEYYSKKIFYWFKPVVDLHWFKPVQ